MTEELALTLHCPKCARLVEVVTAENTLVCLECGYKFDPKIAAKFTQAAPPDKQPPSPPRAPAA
jgi:hypothetical protein